MTELRKRYFEWICELVDCDSNYSVLMSYLFEKNFSYIIDMDGNRYEDGIDLRYRFGYELGIDKRIIASELDICPCSVLEMMAALAFICEEHIMQDDEAGDRTGHWFWEMIESLGLDWMDDSNFDYILAEKIVDKFLNRKYEKNGKGGLFTVDSPPSDMRSAEIWYQMCWHLKKIICQGNVIHGYS